MAKLCSKCGMTSDRDDLCTWCNADLRPPAKGKPAAQAQPQGPPATPAAATPRRRVEAPVAEEPRGRPPWLIPVLAAALALVVLVGGLVVMGVSASGPPPPPGAWQSLTSRDKSLVVAYPAGWGEPSNSGSAGTYVMIDWKPTKLCRVSVEGTQKAGAMGDVAAARERSAGGTVSPEQSADGAMLEFFLGASSFKAQRPGYQEGSPQFDYTFLGGRAAKVEYSYSRRAGLLSVKMKGVRWGHFGGDYGFHVWAEAPEQHWNSFEPTALQIVSGVKPGAGS